MMGMCYTGDVKFRMVTVEWIEKKQVVCTLHEKGVSTFINHFLPCGLNIQNGCLILDDEEILMPV